MVLNDPVEPYASLEPYSPPRSSPDPYSDSDLVSDLANTPYTIDLASIPSPIPVLGHIIGFSKARLVERFQKRLADISASQKRRLATDEVNALLYHVGKAQAIAMWGWPTGVLVGLYRANATRENYGFPFKRALKTTDGWFDGQRIQILGREMLRGSTARKVVHIVRTAGYCSFYSGVFGIMFAFYAAGVQLVGEMGDPRLKRFHHLEQEIWKASVAAKAEESTKRLGDPPRGGAGLASTGPMGELRKKRGGAPAQEGAAPAAFSDDASPLAAEGYDGFMSEDNTTFSGTDDPYNSNNNNTNHNYFPPNADPNTQRQKPSRYPKPSTRTPRPYASPPSSPSLPSDEAPSTPDENFSSDGGSDISVWERIRREAASTDSVWPDGKE